MMKPLARRADLIVQEVDEETLVYDRVRHKAHCLNGTAAKVWRACDGTRGEREIARGLGREFDSPQGAAVVSLALRKLRRAHLLEGDPSRREVVRRLALTGAVGIVLPTVLSILAPTPGYAASGCVIAEDCDMGSNLNRCCRRPNGTSGRCTRVSTGGCTNDPTCHC
jgi:hypothetical protein